MKRESPFADEWRRCLREHYQYIIREQDRVTERSLLTVLHEVGFADSELAELRVLATMRAEDMPDDYLPPEVTAETLFQIGGVAVPGSPPAQESAQDTMVESVQDAVQGAAQDAESHEAAETAEEADNQPDEDAGAGDAPRQMSLF